MDKVANQVLKWIGVKAPWVEDALRPYVKSRKCVPYDVSSKVSEWLTKHIITDLRINDTEYDNDPLLNSSWVTAIVIPGMSVCCNSAGGTWNSIVCNESVCCSYDYGVKHLWLTDNSTCYSTYGYSAGVSFGYNQISGNYFLTYSASITPSSSFTVQGVILAVGSTGSSCASVTCNPSTCPNCDMPLLYNSVNIPVSANTAYSIAYNVYLG